MSELPDARGRSLQIIKMTVINIAVIAIIIISTLMWHFVSQFEAVDANAEETVEIEIPSGVSAAAIANILAEKGLVRSADAFIWSARFKGVAGDLKSGKYRLSKAMTVGEMVDKLSKGEVELVEFVVPEGLTISETAHIWSEEGFGDADEFEKAARTRTYHDGDESAEGYLFPETYRVSGDITAEQMVETMIDTFRRRVEPLIAESQTGKELGVKEIVTIASLIEKEAKLDRERALISAVFHRRLKLGWKLEADPTVRYALGLPRRPLTRKDLEFDSPYNTYLYEGLPPGPICSPGIKSILAAINPADVDYLYFVAKGDGSHVFSRTYAEHRRAIAQIKNRRM